MTVVLASASPRRRALLSAAGIEHRVCPSGVDEAWPTGVPVEEAVLLLAGQKARRAASGEDGPGVLVLGADTVVVLGGEVLGKPAGADEARAMLARLSGRTHQVVTGVCLLEPRTGRCRELVVVSHVTFRELSRAEIDEYVATGEPLDKAGSYGIQGRGGEFVSHLDGSFHNVVGLPVAEVRQLIEEWM